ncbi:hypothetical protein DV515_00018974 [Chloebia gouldiae]|uniref:Uncharacterized protein n=1 Tax=Chloebia gouldiae TaxID=44316 RepID=A0A3L8Q610_CHLGU|nr:hypothetical protein DV515_00018974 [Chloebia gouldiae]
MAPSEWWGRRREQEEGKEEEEEEKEEDGAGQGRRQAQPTAALGLQVPIKRVPRNRIRHWGELVNERGQRQKLGRAGQA